MRIFIIGAGAIGGYFGARLLEAGTDVTFLVRPARLAQLATDGLIVKSPLGSFKSPVAATDDPKLLAKADIVILACKAYGLSAVLDLLDGRLVQGAVVLPLLNGVAHLDQIPGPAAPATVWGGLAHIGVTLMSDGTVHHLNKLNTLMFGLRAGAVGSELAAEFDALLERAGVEGRQRPTIEQDLWDKFTFLTTLAGSTCLMRASIGQILTTQAGEKLILQLLSEASSVAQAEGFAPALDQMARYRAQLTEHGSLATASMLRDIEAGRPTEAYHVLGDMVRRANVHGLAVRGLEMAFTHLEAYEARRTT